MQTIEDLDRLLSDQTVEEIWINSPNSIFIARNGQPISIDAQLSTQTISL